jgi:hypothetical protein
VKGEIAIMLRVFMAVRAGCVCMYVRARARMRDCMSGCVRVCKCVM